MKWSILQKEFIEIFVFQEEARIFKFMKEGDL